MRNKYNLSSSKRKIIISEIVQVLIQVGATYIFYSRVKSFINEIFSIDIMATLGVLFFLGIMLFFLIQAIYNGIIYWKSYNEEWLEINNEEQYLLYKTNLNGQLKEVRVNYDDIYLIKCYKVTYINLYYYEISYNESQVIKKIVVPITLASNIEKKIEKKIKVIKEENVFCSKLPTPSTWMTYKATMGFSDASLDK